MPEPEEPDVRYVVTLGLQGPLYNDATDEPLTRGRWYGNFDMTSTHVLRLPG